MQTLLSCKSIAPQAEQIPRVPLPLDISTIALVYIFSSILMKLRKSKEFNNQGIKIQTKRVFRRAVHFYHQKKQIGSA